ncbi:fungal-specific transcription factor domain-containing protein [Emericellopsis atlantica]|uniref:Fungal-specific transcription factor domain-containing protein n=1 Tax=Emericellopsis atlantica TaxID=2614577 RepID=A0A9P7ZUU8_9HYPO|nr:fungal-specific transcription factor domain-containing protein [Emericellopsis atlantica]KAG9258216.1 fungal-specific transcription factor domain-containing protein [Emericellopsis atlantica]
MLRNFMSTKVRSNAGCWTCRLRRKKCDEKRPVCDGCGSLEITCHFEDEKPDWMDGGPRQKEMADKIKAQVKKQASQRRDRKYMDMLATGTRNVSLTQSDGELGTRYRAESNTINTPHNPSSLTPPSSQTSGGSPPQVTWTNQLFSHKGAQEDNGPDVDVHFIMIYLDYVFPYLFPFYRPPILSGGRGWVLDILQRNKSVYYTAISLASYFFGVIMANGDAVHAECTNRMADKLQEQLQLGLRELQKEMAAMNARKAKAALHEQLIAMQAIVQMVVFEVATGNGDNWKMHLDAAIALFFQILPKPDRWADTLHSLYSYLWPPPSMGVRRPWSTNQAALRFFTASLINMDIMSSIALERAPRLRHYQESIIPACYSRECREHAQTAGPLFMDEFVGLHNWIMHMVADVATLDAWKKEQQQSGTLCVDELVSRGQVLADALLTSLGSLDAEAEAAPRQTVHAMMALVVQDPLPEMGDVVPSEVKDFGPLMAVHNKIWLHGVLLYLYTVVFGWKPEQEDIKHHTSLITCALADMPRGSCLRGMVFPFCVAGCLAPAEDEDRYRQMVQRLGPLQVLGTVKEASEIQEKVWSCRGHLDETFDVAKCLRILGHRSLLI